MRKLLAGLGGLILILVIAVLVAPMFIPASAYKARLEAAASNALGREVTIGDVPRAAILPNPAFTVRGLTIANAPDMSDDYFVSVGEAAIGVKLFPLFSGQVELTGFDLDRPDINLERLADGTVNWALGSGSEAAPEAEEESGSDAIGDIHLGTVSITDGSITYIDRASDQTFEASEADIDLTMTSLDEDLTVDGEMLFQGKPATLDATLTTPRSLMNRVASVLALDFSVEENAVDADINLAGGDIAYDGRLAIDAPSLKSLLATLGMAIDVDSGFNQLFLEGDIDGTGERLSFNDASLTFDEITGNGDLAFDWGGAKPSVTGTLALSEMDLTPYLPEPTAAEEAARESKDAAFPAWPTTPIDFSPLNAINADLTATTDGITMPTMQFGRSDLAVRINDGRLDAELREVNLYDGGGNAAFRVNAARATPQVSTSLDLKGLNAQAFARDFLGMNRLSGIGGVNADLTMTGNNVDSFVRTMNGNGAILLDRGKFEGVDIGKIITAANTLLSGYSQGSFDTSVLLTAVSQAQGPSSETQFSQLESPFTVTNGTLASDSILLRGPLYMIAGEGTVNLPDQSIDMAFLPTVFSSLEDETGRNINLPLMIGGTFNDPTIGFNTDALVRAIAQDRVRGLLRDNGVEIGDSQNVEDALRDRALSELQRALGGTPPRPAPAEEADDSTTAPGDGETAGEEEQAEEPSLEDQLRERALDALFGNRNKQEEEPEEEDGEE